MVIRIQRGLGDAFYNYPIVKHYAMKQHVKVLTPYPIVFDSLPVETSDNYGEPCNLRTTYTRGRQSPFNQYEDLLRSANLSGLPYSFEWRHGFTEGFSLSDVLDFICSHRKRLCVIKEPCVAHVHKRRNDFSIAPNVAEMQKWVDEHPEFCFVSVGQNEIWKERLQNIHFDLTNKTTVQDLISLVSIADMVATQVGHLIPIARAFNKSVKVFYPEKITDSRFQHLNKDKIETGFL